MRWWIIKNGVNTGEIFDDGIPNIMPGEDGFDRSAADAEAARRGAVVSAEFFDRSDTPTE